MASAQILTNGKALYAYNGTEWVPLNTAGNLVNSTRWQKTTTAAQTSLSGNDDYGDSLIYTPGYEQLYLNGVLLARDVDYTATNGTTITGLAPLTAGHIIEVIAYNNINVGNTYTQAQIDNKIANTFERWTKTVSASGTVISGLDDNAVTLDYTAGLEKVYINGILLAPEEYVATSGSAITLDEAVVTNDIIQIHTLKNFRVPNTYTILQTDDQFLTKTSASSTYLSQSSASTTYQTRASAGLVLLNTISFTGQSSVSIGSDAAPLFTSTYKNYRIVVSGEGSAATPVGLNIRMRANTTDNTTGNYFYWQVFKPPGALNSDYGTGSSAFAVGAISGALRMHSVIDIQYPQVLDYTTITASSIGIGASSSEFNTAAGYKNETTQFNGMTLFCSSGTMTGEVSIYAYNA